MKASKSKLNKHQINSILLIGLLSIFIIQPIHAKTLKVAKTGITIDIPENFNELPKSIMDLKWPSKRAPQFAVGNKKASTTIAYDLKDHKIAQKDLSPLMDSFKSTFDRLIPGIIWKKQKIRSLSGQKWIHLEMTSNAVDTDIYNIILVTSFKNKMLMFNFNSTKSEFPQYEKELRKSIKSIKIP